ncbi:hypothetical protein [Enterococcus plantarum]|uniref:hypothetical protein n=1 Tax=Enterococcus plantarum TaxID=1077675 RepID=UPI001A8C8F37|nr:hypothetical protein [Enterococcus plantarum]MBO0423845.1 hypothetical protein [Enterococcus plantarum]
MDESYFDLEGHQSWDDSQFISLRISGREMNKEIGYDLEYVLNSLSSFENMVNKTYLYLHGRNRFSESDKNKLSIKLMDVEEGSFLSVIKIVYDNVLVPATPLVVENKEMIVGIIKSSYKFLKEKIKAEKEGKDVQVTQTSGENGLNINVVNNGSGSVIIEAPRGVPEISQKLVSDFQKITKPVDGKEIDSIEIKELSETDGKVTFDATDKTLFEASTFTQDKEIIIIGKVLDSSYTKKNGKIQVIESDFVKKDVYKFVMDKDIQSEEVWREMYLHEQSYVCKCKMEYNPAKNAKPLIKEIVIIDAA